MAFVHEHGMVSREERIKDEGLPNIRYFTFDEQQNFINNLPLVKGSTLNTLSQIQQTLEASNVPLIIPYTTSYDKKWTYEQLEAFAMQGIQVYQNKENGIPQFPYIYNQIGASKAPGYKTYYERFLTTELPDPRIYTGIKTKKPPRVSVFQPQITEEVTVDAPQEITLDSIVSGITQAVTVQEAAAEPLASTILPAPTLSQETRKILDDFYTNKIKVPEWFARNNINWVQQGKISEEEFIAGYTNLLNTGVITIPTAPTPTTPTPPPIDTSTSLTMISQKWDYFDIVDGRAKGQITFRATSDFNPYYYGKELVNYMQLVNNQGVTIVLKPNVLRFTQTETDETIQYDEGVGDLKSLKVESYVWTHDNQPMSSLYKFPIYEGKPPGTGTGELARTDFLAKMGGVLAGSIAIALLLPKRIGK